jgi:UDP-GlcNAc:undecaprenyl-phosphate/decaprenyl-phosphate GlcNAc-1-phosphate transferase
LNPYFIHSLPSLPLWSLIILSIVAAFLITYYAIPSIVTVSLAKGLYAKPNGRTSHVDSIPNLGGIAIFSGFILSTVIIGGPYFNFELVYIIAGLIIIFMVGVKDDILILDPRKKLIAQILAATLIAVLADIRIDNFHGLFNLFEIPYLPSILITLFVFIVIINGFNLIDGIDGLASGIGILTSSVFGFWFLSIGNKAYSVMSFAFAGSLAAFFWYNIFSIKNKIFLGDTGSLIIGLVMSVLAIRFLQFDLMVRDTLFIQSAPAVAFGVLVIPLFDTLRVFVLRMSQGKSPFVGDRQHLHHRLLQLGMTHLQATLTLASVNVAFVIVCYLLQDIGIIWLMVVILATASALSRFLVLYIRYRKRRIIEMDYQAVEKFKALYKKNKNPIPEEKEVPAFTKNVI